MLAKDIMNPNVITLRDTDSLKKAAEVLLTKNITGTPVVDSDGKLLGVISEGDLVRKEKNVDLPVILTFFEGTFPINYRKIKSDLEAITARNVAELMTKPAKALSSDTKLPDIASFMIEEKINRVPIVDDGEMVGIVTRRDIIKAIYLTDEVSMINEPEGESFAE